MKVGILIPCYNRPKYLKECLWGMQRLKIPENTTILIIDDASTDQWAIEMINSFQHPTAKVVKHTNKSNLGIKGCLLYGYEHLFSDHDLVINFDSDALVRADAVDRLVSNYFCGILTGFHCTTRNSNGTERHKILYEECGLYVKQSVGGINMCVNKEAYVKYVKPALLQPIGNWDHQACINAGYAYCLKQSVVQHIGFESSMGHHEQPDVADDFYYWDLPDVTLIGVDNNLQRLEAARDICTKFIRFGDVKLLNPGLTSKEQYSQFCIRELYKHVETSHMLVFQHDGYVHNWKTWDNEWLQYDYIGAPWHYGDGMAVGNGGFSLRSRELMEAVSKIADFTHPEDHHICRTYRPQLEAMGFKFAPIEVAEKFSFEGYMQPTKHLSDQFGKHGVRVHTPKVNGTVIFNQFAGLGDILFLVPMARALQAEGRRVIWPVIPEYLAIQKHFPDIEFVDKSIWKLPYDERRIVDLPEGRLLPYRFAIEILGRTMKDCMRSKMELFGHDYRIWRNLYWQRDKQSENKLKELVNAIGEYIVVNRGYGLDAAFQINPVLPEGIRIIEMSIMPEFTLLDWLGVIEGAKEVHMSNSSLNYVLEIANLPIPIHIYKRGLWGETAFEHTRYLWENKNFIFHE